MQALKRSTIYLVVLALTACGGGDSSSSVNKTSDATSSTLSPSTVAAGMVGIFDVDFGDFKGVYTLLDDGRFSGIHYVNTYSIVGSPHTTLNMGAPTEILRPVMWSNFGAGGGYGLFEKDVRFIRTVDNSVLHVELSSQDIGSFAANIKVQRSYGGSSTKTLYFDAMPLSAYVGNYTGEGRTVNFLARGQTITDFNLDAQGSFLFTSANCTFKGNISPHNNTGVFDVQAQTSGSNCSYVGSLDGILTPISLTDNRPRIGLQLSSPNNLESAVFIVQKN